ncbi:MAG: hypothetical protein A2520_09630 [Deltaproteobacteria bacterium RIFOXYD12_FULL_53_23]|nr:MAG: hypothetical protein A2520_09630 [Deltaproteobacteria bacterium RIFOXYD12_FULL_53_23]
MRYHAGNLVFCASIRCYLAVSLILLALIVGCKQPEDPAAPKPQPALGALTFCHGGITNILPLIALKQGYFAEEGLSVTLKDLDGRQAFTGMLQGECNFAVSAEPPIVLADPQRTPFAILATVLDDDNSVRIIARRDQGIAKPEDLKGKRLGVKKGIMSHIFLDLFMIKHGLKHNEVVRVFMEPEAFQPALLNGEIDGFSMSSRMLTNAAHTLGDKAVVFAEPGLFPVHAILTTRLDIPLNLQAAPRVLRALVRAEQYAKSEPAAAKTMVAKSFKLSAQDIEDVWCRTTIKVALANSLFSHLDNQYTWLQEHDEASEAASMPNYLTLVAPEYLRAIRPDSVSDLIP